MDVEDAARQPSRSRRRAAQLLLPALVGLTAAYAAMSLVPATTAPLGPAEVSVTGRVGQPRTFLTIPPLGTVSAATHAGPLHLELTFKTIDFELLGPLATTPPGRRELAADTRRDLEDVLQRAALQLVLGGMVTGAIVVALLWHRRWTAIAAGALGGGLGVAGLLALTGATFDIGAFDEPRYSGTLARAPVVIETLRDSPSVLDDLRSRYETASRRLSDLLVLVARPDTDPRIDATAILHVSDIHANPLGLEIADQLAAGFDVDAVLDTGDLASSTVDTGSLSSLAGPIDRRLRQLIETLGVPYYFVPGNHDSPLLLRTLRRAPNVTIFDDEVLDVGGIRVLGWSDPTFTTDSGVTPDEKNEARTALAGEVAEAVEEAAPDVLAVHDQRLAAEAIGLVPLVLAGHTHERGLVRGPPTTVLTVGSTGATGLKSLTLEADKSYEAEILYFRDAAIVAVDYITFSGSSDFQVERTTLSLSATPSGG